MAERASAVVSAPDDARDAVAAGRTVSDAVVEMLVGLGIREAFGIIGGAIAPFCDVLGRAGCPRLFAMRHEGAAAFAAAEASLAASRPTLVFTTTGPGLTNALTGVCAARTEGARVLVVCGATSAAQRGRGAVQETSRHGLAIDAVGGLFDLAVTVESAAELPALANRLAYGFAKPAGFVALVALPLSLQRALATEPLVVPRVATLAPRAGADAVAGVVDALAEPFAIWAGYGARGAARQVRALAERTGSRVLCTPRAKGVFPERHPLFAGVTGFGGHAAVEEMMERERPRHVLVLGSRLGEYSSIWDPRLVPARGFIHVDVDERAFAAAYPDVPTRPVLADIGAFLDEVLAQLPDVRVTPSPAAAASVSLVARPGPVRPQVLMDVIQRVVIDGTDAIVMAEPGNSFAWTNHHLRFPSPRYRMSGYWASMGHMVTGAVGASVATGRQTVVVTGDGSMLMLNELSSAASYGARIVWIVLNDGRFGITEAGMSAQGFTPIETRFPKCDFAALARAVGANGMRVTSELELTAGVEAAMRSHGPFVLDVDIDVAERAPFLRRIQALSAMGAAPGGRS
ncbi:MAG TPA: thiamine pyrophosphate-binding protein [Vicinamibacterales bacterium]|nr:thiamine pyrophosphate-binding protein [Vicinamibacterales bacterium]